MKNHWRIDKSLTEIYNKIDNEALDGVLRPIVFIIASNRKFDLKGFEESLNNSLSGSKLTDTTNLLHLFIGTKIFIPSKNMFKFLSVKRFKMGTKYGKSDDIGCIREFQSNMAREACEMLENPILIIMDDDLKFKSTLYYLSLSLVVDLTNHLLDMSNHFLHPSLVFHAILHY